MLSRVWLLFDPGMMIGMGARSNFDHCYGLGKQLDLPWSLQLRLFG